MSLLNQIKKASQAEVYLKVLLSGDDGAGKSTSVIYGAERPLLVIDPESKASAYGHVADFDLFDDQDPDKILHLTQELLSLQEQGVELPYKSVLVDSATVLYKYIINQVIDQLRVSEGLPNKHKLEPIEYQIPQKKFYEIINNLKKLKMHVFLTAHVKDNYLKGAMFKVDPNTPKKPDVEGRLPYEVHLHMMFRKTGKDRYKAERMRSNILDKERNHLIPPVIDNFDNYTIIKNLHEYATCDKGFQEEKPAIQNVIHTNATVSNFADDIIKMVAAIGMSNEQAATELQKVTGKMNPYELSSQESETAYKHFAALANSQGGTE